MSTVARCSTARGNPTVEVEVVLEDGSFGRAMVPSGASTGAFEACELRDGDKGRYLGKGVLAGRRPRQQRDAPMPSWASMPSISAPSMPTLIAAGRHAQQGQARRQRHPGRVAGRCQAPQPSRPGLPLYQYVGGVNAHLLPTPMMNILNGGVHADNNVDFQEFMIMPVGAPSFAEGLRWCAEIYHTLKKRAARGRPGRRRRRRGRLCAQPQDQRRATSSTSPRPVEKAGYKPGVDFMFAMDPASTEFYNAETGMYELKGEGRRATRAPQMVDYWEALVDKYPIISIEDGMAEEDWDGWNELTERIGDKVQLVGDDLFVTNTERLKKGIELGAANAILVKVNQIGTLTETLEAIETAKEAGYACIVSHRSGETEDTTIADLVRGRQRRPDQDGRPVP